jgi:hypothetical protein
MSLPIDSPRLLDERQIAESIAETSWYPMFDTPAAHQTQSFRIQVGLNESGLLMARQPTRVFFVMSVAQFLSEAFERQASAA